MKTEMLEECIRIVRKGQTLQDQDICLDTVEGALAELTAIESALAAKDEALYIAHHDTKEPIRSLRFYLKLIEDLGCLDEEHTDYLHAAVRDIDHIEKAMPSKATLSPPTGKVLVDVETVREALAVMDEHTPTGPFLIPFNDLANHSASLERIRVVHGKLDGLLKDSP